MYAKKIPMKVLSRYVSIIQMMRQDLDQMSSATVVMCDQIRSELHRGIALLAGVHKDDAEFESWLSKTVEHMLDCHVSVTEELKNADRD